MEEKLGFLKMTTAEFSKWIKKKKVGRTVIYIQEHHTYIPNYTHFDNGNHFEMQQNMKRYHVHHNGWSDIGQHLTIFPDGSILTGRSMERSPACIFANNAHAICIESVGNFDKNGDVMTKEQKQAIIEVTATLCAKFDIPINIERIVYHHWFSLATGTRNDGTRNNKSCPGTNFFGGNKTENAKQNFIPKVKKAYLELKTESNAVTVKKYVIITATRLRVRKGPGTSNLRATDRDSLILGAILRVYGEKDGWLKISSSAQHWISGRYTDVVLRATVNANVLNVRTGPGTQFNKVDAIKKGFEVFIQEEVGNWCKISMEDKWVSKSFLDFA